MKHIVLTGGGTAGHHIAAHKGDVGIIGDTLTLSAYIGRLFNRLALTGEACLTDEQILCIQNADIGGELLSLTDETECEQLMLAD